MQKEQKMLSDIIVNTKYAKYDYDLNRRETWHEICIRNLNMHLKHYENMDSEFQTDIINIYYDYVLPKKVLPSMRSMQFAGKPITLSPNRIYNCAYMPIDSYRAFSETMFLLLGGTGVGYSVQKHHVAKLSPIQKPIDRSYRHLIGDSIEGWAEAVRVLFDSYTGKRSSTPLFDYSDIRPLGSILKTSGGKAPGPEPLKKCITVVQGMLNNMENNHSIEPIEAHDMLCHIADAVLAGGIRRAALISLFSPDDLDMLTAKSGQFWETNPQRGRANNSAVLLRETTTIEEFQELWNRIEKNGTGEPGIFFTNDDKLEWGTNPCCEIALRPFQFCNLTEVNVSDVESQQELNDRIKAAAFLATLQTDYTDFHYLREKWRTTTEKDALLGVSMTGIASDLVTSLDLIEAAAVVRHTNAVIAEKIGVKPAARLTCVKPAGTTSCVLGTSSGIHAWYDKYYIRNIQIGKEEPIYQYLLDNIPELVADYAEKPTSMCVVSIPQKAPYDTVITRDKESTLNMLERVKKFSLHWVRNGHRNGINTHNVSATVNIKDDEWDSIGEWFWDNREYYNGLAVLPFDTKIYDQAPFIQINEDEYKHLMSFVKELNLTDIIELEDNTNLQGEIACAGGCEII